MVRFILFQSPSFAMVHNEGLPRVSFCIRVWFTMILAWTVPKCKLFKLLVYNLLCIFFPYHKSCANLWRAFGEIITQKENICYL